MDVDRLKRFAELTLAKRRLIDELNRAQSELDDLEPAILSAYEDEEVSSIRVDLGEDRQVTVHLASELWVNAGLDDDGARDYAGSNAWLQGNGLGEFVQPRFNVQSLSAWVREEKKEKGELPKGFRDAFSVREGFRVRVRGGSQ